MTEAPRITAQSWLMIATLAFVWGGTFLVTEVALTGMGPFWIAASRVGLAALVLTLLWGLRGWHLFEASASGADWLSIGIIGAISSTLPFALLAWGQQYVTAGFAGVSMASVALILLPLAHLFVPGERLTTRRGIGFLVGFVGVVVLIGGGAFESSGAAREGVGRLACIGAASCYAVSSILMRRLPPVDPIGLATILLIVGAFCSIPLAFAVEALPPMPTPELWGVLLFLGLVPTAAAAFLRVLVVRSAGPVFMSLVNYQVPVWSVLLGALILSEPLPPSLLGAMALILCGVAISQWGALRRLFAGPASG
ncbi:MAG: DMT family transporter [Sulfitobacter sp.]|nr:DMT family transporter [Sulfitobacter sp.]